MGGGQDPPFLIINDIIMFVSKKAFKFLLPREVEGRTSLSQTLPSLWLTVM